MQEGTGLAWLIEQAEPMQYLLERFAVAVAAITLLLRLAGIQWKMSLPEFS